eukprot:1161726-Pelagomonas_calceolata.AAC.3
MQHTKRRCATSAQSTKDTGTSQGIACTDGTASTANCLSSSHTKWTSTTKVIVTGGRSQSYPLHGSNKHPKRAFGPCLPQALCKIGSWNELRSALPPVPSGQLR